MGFGLFFLSLSFGRKRCQPGNLWQSFHQSTSLTIVAYSKGLKREKMAFPPTLFTFLLSWGLLHNTYNSPLYTDTQAHTDLQPAPFLSCLFSLLWPKPIVITGPASDRKIRSCFHSALVEAIRTWSFLLSSHAFLWNLYFNSSFNRLFIEQTLFHWFWTLASIWI